MEGAKALSVAPHTQKRTQIKKQSQKQSKMISPLKDIVIATGLGLIAGAAWNSWKDGELKRTTNFYKFYEAQQAKKITLSADDDDDE